MTENENYQNGYQDAVRDISRYVKGFDERQIGRKEVRMIPIRRLIYLGTKIQENFADGPPERAKESQLAQKTEKPLSSTDPSVKGWSF